MTGKGSSLKKTEETDVMLVVSFTLQIEKHGDHFFIVCIKNIIKGEIKVKKILMVISGVRHCRVNNILPDIWHVSHVNGACQPEQRFKVKKRASMPLFAQESRQQQTTNG